MQENISKKMYLKTLLHWVSIYCISELNILTLKPPPTRLIYCRPHNIMVMHTNKVIEHITSIHGYSTTIQIIYWAFRYIKHKY